MKHTIWACVAWTGLALGAAWGQEAAKAEPGPAQAAKAEPAAAGTVYAGDLLLPGNAMKVVVRLTPAAAADAAPEVRLSIPQQNVKEAVCKEVVLEPAGADGTRGLRFTFLIPPMPPEAAAKFDLKVSADGATAEGTMRQAGMGFGVKLKRQAAGEAGAAGDAAAGGAGPARPQEPKPPFAYATEEVTFSNPADGAKLTGTLTLPTGASAERPVAAVVLITGSGPQDRNEEIFGHKPFLLIADRLTRAGVAVLRHDDRGVGGSSDPSGGKATTDMLAGDTAAAVAFLRTRPEIDRTRIGLIGHSEGGVIAPLVAAEKPDEVGFVALLAGTGVNGGEVLAEQNRAMMLAAGVEAGNAARAAQAMRMIATVLAGGEVTVESPALRQQIRSLVRAQRGVPDGDGPGAEDGGGAAEEAMVTQAAKTLLSPWMRRFITLEPGAALRKVRCPVLVMNGGKDVQVTAEQNVPAIVSALLEGGNREVTVHVLPRLNHLFQPVPAGGTGSVQEYGTITTTMDEGALRLLAEWVVRVSGGGGSGK